MNYYSTTPHISPDTASPSRAPHNEVDQLFAFIHVMGRDERWSRLGSVLYIVSISFLIIYGIIQPNHPDPDDFTLSTSNMSEVPVRTEKCR